MDKHQTFGIAHLLNLYPAHELPCGILLVDAHRTHFTLRLSKGQSFHSLLPQPVIDNLQSIGFRPAQENGGVTVSDVGICAFLPIYLYNLAVVLENRNNGNLIFPAGSKVFPKI